MASPPVLHDPLSRLLRLGGELVTAPGEPRRKFDLAHMRALLSALGDPHLRFPSILIAGTNGKGSTAATLASILASAGYLVGLYTSPHLLRVNERIQLLVPEPGSSPDAPHPTLSLEIDDALLSQHLDRVEQASTALVAEGALPALPSFFEAVTAIALLTFASAPGHGRPVDIAILEVGMGGRLDATNVVEPLLSVITDISLDHTEWLGPTITAIAREKAGILRPGGIMVTLPQHPEANQALGEVAVPLGVRGVNAADYLPGRELAPPMHDASNRYTLGGIEGLDSANLTIDSPLSGQHQQRNIALALAAALELRNKHSYKLNAAQIEAGIRETRWPGRLEQLPPRHGRPAVLLDVAHNPAGAWALRAALSRWAPPPSTVTGYDTARHLVFGCMRDKALSEMAQILFPIFDHVFLTELPSPRSASLAELAAVAEQTGTPHTTFVTPQAALAAALSAAGSLLVVSGSVVLVGAAREQLA